MVKTGAENIDQPRAFVAVMRMFAPWLCVPKGWEGDKLTVAKRGGGFVDVCEFGREQKASTPQTTGFWTVRGILDM